MVKMPSCTLMPPPVLDARLLDTTHESMLTMLGAGGFAEAAHELSEENMSKPMLIAPPALHPPSTHR